MVVEGWTEVSIGGREDVWSGGWRGYTRVRVRVWEGVEQGVKWGWTRRTLGECGAVSAEDMRKRQHGKLKYEVLEVK